MNILYLTPAWFGFDKMIYEGVNDITGLPSFSHPLKMLVEDGHNVDMIILHTSDVPEFNINSEWVKKINIIAHFQYSLRLPWKLLSIVKYRNLVKKTLKNGCYDFVYVHGSSPSVANDIVRKFNIPLGQRLYGTFLWDKIKKQGLFKTKLKHLVEYFSFVSPKNFLLATDDGSGADNVIKSIYKNTNPPYDFFYWKNGVARIDIDPDYERTFVSENLSDTPYLFYCARFDSWKRQDRIIEILHQLKNDYISIKVIFAGPFDTLGDHYYKQVVKLASDLGVIEQCIFLGSISKKDIYLYNKYAVASLSLYDVCNVTSVFHEMMASGSLIIVRDDSDVREFIQNGKNGFLVKENSECISLIKEIIRSPTNFKQIREDALISSKKLTLDWSSRSKMEVELIKKCVFNKQV